VHGVGVAWIRLENLAVMLLCLLQLAGIVKVPSGLKYLGSVRHNFQSVLPSELGGTRGDHGSAGLAVLRRARHASCSIRLIVTNSPRAKTGGLFSVDRKKHGPPKQ